MLFIKHTSRHYYKLGKSREFYDQENPLSPEATEIVLALQDKYDSLIDYLGAAYQALRSGGTPGEMPDWLKEEVSAKVNATVASSSSASAKPQGSEPSTSPKTLSLNGNQKPSGTSQISA
jgi:hypothetical protein